MNLENEFHPPSETAIYDFWSWLAGRQTWLQEQISGGDERADAIDEICAMVDSLQSSLHWEIGPSHDGIHRWFFAISPSGDRRKLQLCRQVVAAAGEFDLDWEILPAKPRRRLIRRRVGLRACPEIDYSGWEYSLISYNDDEFFDVFLVPDVFHPEISQKSYGTMGYIIVDGELGEELSVERIGKVAITPREEVGRLTNIQYLYDHIQSIIGKSD